MQQQAVEQQKELENLRDSFYKDIENNETENIVEAGEKIKNKIDEINRYEEEDTFKLQHSSIEDDVKAWIKVVDQELFLKEQKAKIKDIMKIYYH